MAFYTYILATHRNGTLYTGHTDNLAARLTQHRDGTFQGFTDRYGIYRLVWFETHDTRDDAFKRERRIKEWKRLWKLRLIERFNPRWDDLARFVFQPDLLVGALTAEDWLAAFERGEVR